MPISRATKLLKVYEMYTNQQTMRRFMGVDLQPWQERLVCLYLKQQNCLTYTGSGTGQLREWRRGPSPKHVMGINGYITQCLNSGTVCDMRKINTQHSIRGRECTVLILG